MAAIFSAVGYVLDDLFDFGVVGDVCGAELVKTLFECTVVVVFVVCDIMEPRGGDCVEHHTTVLVEEVNEEEVA